MTDVAERNLGFWQAHPQFAADLAAGRLALATFDAEEPEAARLAGSGENLADALRGQSLIVVANFMLDVLPYDLFRVRDGALEACAVDLHLPDGVTLDEEAGPVIAQTTLATRFVEAVQPFYADAADEVLLLAHAAGDPWLVTRLPAPLAEASTAARGERRAILARLLAASWWNYFDLGEAHPLAEQLGRLLYALRATHAARFIFGEAARRAPRDHLPHYWLGRCAARLGETAVAGEHFRQALALRPQHVGSRRRLQHLPNEAGAGQTLAG